MSARTLEAVNLDRGNILRSVRPGRLSVILLLDRFDGPFRIRSLRAFHRPPQDAVKDVFGAAIHFLQRQAAETSASCRSTG